MNRLIAGLVPALLITTAAGAAMAQDMGPVSFKLDAGGGVEGFNLPSYNPGMGQTVSGNMLGGMITGKMSVSLGQMNGWGVLLGLNTFGAFGGASVTTAQNPTLVDLCGLDCGAPGSTINIVQGTPNASASVTGPGGATSTSATATGPADVGGVAPDGTGFVMSAVTSDGTNGAAYAGFGSSLGGEFVGAGPMTLTTKVSRSVVYVGADATIGLTGMPTGGASFQVYAGPSVRSLTQGVVTSFNVNILEVPTTPAIVLPEYKLVMTESLTSNYAGGVVGGDVVIDSGQGVMFTLGAQGGAYIVTTTYRGHDTYSTCCGLTGSPQFAPSPTISVNGPSHMTDLGTAVAFAGQVNGGATIKVDDNKTVTFGGNAGYLSYVPTMDRTGGTLVFGSSSMITYGATATFGAKF